MHRFFTEEPTQAGQTVSLAPEDAGHALRVLRLETGDQVELVSSLGRWLAEISDCENGQVRAKVLEMLPNTECCAQVVLYQGLPKADKMEMICQKATELGAASIVPVGMVRSVVRLAGKDAQKKAERWQKICREAVKQCARVQVPGVAVPMSLTQAIEDMKKCDLLIVPWEIAENGKISDLVSPGFTGRIGIVIGPEGGMTREEIVQMEAAGAKTVTLGPRILRTETAALTALTLTMQALGEM